MTLFSTHAITTSQRLRCALAFVVLLAHLIAAADVGVAQDWLAQIPGHSDEEAEDLRVKVLGGFLGVTRTRLGDRWVFNPELTPLNISTSCSAAAPAQACTLRLARGSNVYAPTGGTPVRYVGAGATIVRRGDGWRWEDGSGEWIDYAEDGTALSFGDRNGVIGQVLRNTDGQIRGLADAGGHEVLTYDVDGSGRVIRARDYSGREVRYVYDGQLLVGVTDVRGKVWTDTYNAANQLSSRTDPEGRVTTYTYDGNGVLITIRDQDGVGVDFTHSYDRTRQEYYVRESSTGGRVIESWYKVDDGLIRQVVNGQTVLSVRSSAGARILTDENGNETRFQLDVQLRVTDIIHADGGRIHRVLDPALGLPRSVTNENGVTTTFEYDAAGNLIRLTEAVGRPEMRVTELAYDPRGQLVTHREIVDGSDADRLTLLTYDDYGNVTSITDPEGNFTRFAHDAQGNITQRIDPRGGRWDRTYDDAGNLVHSLNPGGATMSFEYDDVGNLVRLIDAEGAITVVQYNGQNRATAVVDPLQHVWQYEYSAAGLRSRDIDPYGITRRYTYDPAGRLTSLTDGGGNVARFEYLAGHSNENPTPEFVARITFPTFKRVRRFDVRGRLSTEVDSGGGLSRTTRFLYDPVGNVTAVIMPDGRKAEMQFDALNRVTAHVSSDQRVARITADVWNQMVRITDPLGATTELAYDKIGRLESETRPGGGVRRFGYDANGNLTSIVDAREQRLEYAYDLVNRLVAEQSFQAPGSEPSSAINYAYNRRGDLLDYTTPDHSASYTYDLAGRLTTTNTHLGSFTASTLATYYANGLPESFTGPDGVTYEYRYDPSGRLQSVGVPGHGVVTFGSYRWNLPTRVMLPGGAVQQYEFDAFARATRIGLVDPGGNPVLDHHYTWDPAIDLLREKSTEHGLSRYGYDDAGRLISAEHAQLPSESYAYDEGGNRRPADAPPSLWTYGADNLLVRAVDMEFEYDAAGNQIRKYSPQSETRYFYDEQSRLVRVEADGAVLASYGYDPLGRRLWKDIQGGRTYFAYAGSALIAEMDDEGNVERSFGYRPGSTMPLFLHAPDEYLYYGNDYLGTPQILTTSAGDVAWSALYASFGAAQITTDAVSNPIRLPGQRYDEETGLHQNYFRDYDPQLGRYMQMDPLGVVGGLNPYLYANANPLTFTDPLGLFPWECTLTSVVGTFDTLSLGLSSLIRNGLGLEGGLDKCSDCYKQASAIIKPFRDLAIPIGRALLLEKLGIKLAPAISGALGGAMTNGLEQGIGWLDEGVSPDLGEFLQSTALGSAKKIAFDALGERIGMNAAQKVAFGAFGGLGTNYAVDRLCPKRSKDDCNK